MARESARPVAWRTHVPTVLLCLLFASSVGLLVPVEGGQVAAAAWPAAGLLTALALVTDIHRRATTLALGTVLLFLAHLLVGSGPVVTVGLTAATALGSLATLRRLRHGLDRAQPGLIEEGDVSRLISAVAQGGAVSAAVGAATAALADTPASPGLTAVAVLATHAGAQLMILPLCLEGPPFGHLAPGRERLAQSLIVLGATLAIFAWSAAPPLVFAVMPMFGWLAFRGTLREATWLLAGVGTIAIGLTLAGVGPVAMLSTHYALAPELTIGFLQLFLIDCALILLPLSVMAAQQQLATARARAREQTIQRLVDAATGTAVLATDLEGRLEVVNPGAEAILGVRADDVLGRSADALFGDVELSRHAVALGTQPIFAEICAASVAGDGGRLLWQATCSGGGSWRWP